MVGHLMLYNSAYEKMKEKIKQGLIGKIRYIYSNRLAFGKFRKEEEYSKGEVTATSAFLAACDIKKCPKDPITPRLIANVN